mmetsp:Transcript_6271/g.9925  ORF Transcript_6271/g.9925 Transcript_6271/m.9925 type:complete len:205 (-) Transcript_6271:313-927(-)
MVSERSVDHTGGHRVCGEPPRVRHNTRSSTPGPADHGLPADEVLDWPLGGDWDLNLHILAALGTGWHLHQHVSVSWDLRDELLSSGQTGRHRHLKRLCVLSRSLSHLHWLRLGLGFGSPDHLLLLHHHATLNLRLSQLRQILWGSRLGLQSHGASDLLSTIHLVDHFALLDIIGVIILFHGIDLGLHPGLVVLLQGMAPSVRNH